MGCVETALVLVATTAVEVAGAFANHFWFKNDVLKRMMSRYSSKSI